MRQYTYCIILLVALAISGCEQKVSDPVSGDDTAHPVVANVQQVQARTLLVDPLTPEVFELPSQALVSWRAYAALRPVLVLLADQPYLTPLAPELKDEALSLLRSGSAGELQRRGDYDQPDPLILSPQAVRAAFEAGLFRELVWILPDDRGLDEFSWDIVRDQLRATGLLDPTGDLTLGAKPGLASYLIGDTPVTLVHPDGLADLTLDQPALFHADLSYFKQTYRSEARIPAIELLLTISRMLRQASINVYSVTLSYSTQDGYVGLDGRFTLQAFAQLLQDPDLLDRKLPDSWRLRSKALQAATMFQEQKTSELYEQLVQLTPDDPGALFALAQRQFFQSRFHEGVALLDRAVQNDPGYAGAYMVLSDKAREAGDLNNALNLMEKAGSVYPDNPGVQLRYADLLYASGRIGEARQIIARLKALPWSPVYHPEVQAILEQLESAYR